ncbi:dUTP diphosphatase [Peribacillus sp. YIM B13482]|uniref:dUTP diphosphatase n=1 Tax=Peribacillus sp. YIM B13482 TaxID=3366298 RepID=UPI00366A7D05
MNIKVLKTHPLAKVPEYAHPADAGMDLYSVEEKLLQPGETSLLKTGIKIGLPKNTEAQIRPRSGLALKHSITVLNSPGTIDEGYRGEIGVILINHGKDAFHIEVGMRIAQMVIQPTYKVVINEVSKLSVTARNEGGFGSSGIR